MEDLTGDDADCISDVTYEMDLQQELQSFLDVKDEYEDANQSDEGDIDDANALFEYDIPEGNIDVESPSSILTQEENEVISNCTDPILRRLLINNRVKCRYLKILYSKLVKVQHICEFYYVKELSLVKNTKEEIKYNYPTRTFVSKLRMPYFKDSQNFFAPHNADYQKKIDNNEYFLAQYGEDRRWSEKEQKTLQLSIETMYYKHRKSQLENQLDDLKVKITADKEDVLDKKQLEKYEIELKVLTRNRDERLTPSVNVDIGVDWLQVANDLSYKHTMTECKAIWNIYLHPHINKLNWAASEDEKIKQLVSKHKEQNWDAIAEKLETGRSGYLVCVHYYTKLSNKFKKDYFQPDEDELILKAVDECRLGPFIPWSKVSQYFKDRSKDQLYHRYKYYLLPMGSVIKGHFSMAEDVFLIYMKQYEGKSFVAIADSMNRTSVQLRSRYTNYLEKHFPNLGIFSFEDDITILKHVKERGEKNWNELGIKLNKNRSHVRQRYLTITRHMKTHPESRIEDIPKRKNVFHMKFKTEREKTVNSLLNKLATYTGSVTLQIIENFIRRGKYTPTVTRWRIVKKNVSFADQKLIEFFKGTCKIKKKQSETDDDSIMESAKRIVKLYELLGGDVAALKTSETNIRDIDVLLSERELSILNVIKNLTAVSNAGTFVSEVQTLKLKTVQNILPPNLNTILGLRGFIVKYELFTDKKDCEPTALNTEQRLFLNRFFALFKWPCIISIWFPEQLNKNDQQEIVAETEAPLVTPKIGRPRKKVNVKVLKMVEAKKRKKAESKDTITYIPKRGKMKIKSEVDDDASEIEEAEEVGENSTTAFSLDELNTNCEFEKDLRNMDFEETMAAEYDDRFEEDLEELASKKKIAFNSKLK